MGKPIRYTEEEFAKLLQKSGRTPEPVKNEVKKVKKSVLTKIKKKIKTGFKKLPDPDAIDPIARKGVKTLQEGLSFGKGYKAKDTVGHITRSTSTMRGTRGEYSRNGLRSEFTIRGYTGESGFPELANRWARATRTEAKGSLNLGGKPRVKGSLATPAPTLTEMVPSLGFYSEVRMPKVRKIKGRKL